MIERKKKKDFFVFVACKCLFCPRSILGRSRLAKPGRGGAGEKEGIGRKVNEGETKSVEKKNKNKNKNKNKKRTGTRRTRRNLFDFKEGSESLKESLIMFQTSCEIRKVNHSLFTRKSFHTFKKRLKEVLPINYVAGND
jgi:hypothetical protein